MDFYRFTPPGRSPSQTLSLGNVNSGSLNGTLAFFMDRRALSARCAIDPTNLRCFLAPLRDVRYGRWTVLVDPQMGPYKSCVPLYTNEHYTAWNTTLPFRCSQTCDAPTIAGVPSPRCDGVPRVNASHGPDGQLTCFCARSKQTIGAYDVGADRVPRPPAPLALRGCYYRGVAPRSDDRCVTGSELLGSVPVSLSAASSCCDACGRNENCAGWNLRIGVCDLYGPGDLTSQPREDPVCGVGFMGVAGNGSWCDAIAPLAPLLPGGTWNWDISSSFSSGWWFSTTAENECAPGVNPSTSQSCSWRLATAEEAGDEPSSWSSSAAAAAAAAVMLVNASCVQRAIDDALEATAPMARCLAERNCSSSTTKSISLYALAAARERDCFLYCSWEALGGSGFPATVGVGPVVAAFHASMNGGCPRIVDVDDATTSTAPDMLDPVLVPGLDDVCAHMEPSEKCSPEICDLKPGTTVRLEEKTYYQDRSIVMPAGVQLIGAGINKTIIVACGHYNNRLNPAGRRGFILGNNTYLGHYTWQGIQKSRGNFDAAIGTVRGFTSALLSLSPLSLPIYTSSHIM